MAEDPRRVFVNLVARLGREAQLHLDERYRHIEITNYVITAMFVVMAVIAVFNFYYASVLWTNFNGIVSNMDSMHNNLQRVDTNMASVTDKVGLFDAHMQHMDKINQNTGNLAKVMPEVRGHMSSMTESIANIDLDMAKLSEGMTNIDVRFAHMTSGVQAMRGNVRQIAKPMGAMNPFMP